MLTVQVVRHEASNQRVWTDDHLDAALGLDAIVGLKLASIIVFAANIEHYLERAIRVLEEIYPQGTRPQTDSKPISKLLTMLEKHAAGAKDNAAQDMLQN